MSPKSDSLNDARLAIQAKIQEVDAQVQELGILKKSLIDSEKNIGNLITHDKKISFAGSQERSNTVVAKNTVPAAKRGPKPSATQPKIAQKVAKSKDKKAGKTAKVTAVRKRSTTLPKTGAEFFKALVGPVPKSLSELLDDAKKALKVPLDVEDAVKLKSRLATCLDSLVKTNKVTDRGQGRERVFLSVEAASA